MGSTTTSGPGWMFMSDEERRRTIDREHANLAYQRESARRHGLITDVPATGSTTDGNASNPNFSWNNEELWNRARQMSQTQLDNTLRTMGAASGYRQSELRLNDEITRGQAQQQFGFNRQLADDNYNFQRQRAEQDFGFNRTLANDGYDFQIRKTNLDDEITRRQNEQRFGFERTLANDNYAFRDRDRAERERAADESMEREYQMRRESTNSARDTASRAFFGGGDRYASRR